MKKIDLLTPTKDFLYGVKRGRIIIGGLERGSECIAGLEEVPTLYELCRLSWLKLLSLPNVGDTTVGELATHLEEYGLSLGMTKEELDAYSGIETSGYVEPMYTIKSSSDKRSIMATILAALIISRGSAYMNDKIMDYLITWSEILTDKLIERCDE